MLIWCPRALRVLEWSLIDCSSSNTTSLVPPFGLAANWNRGLPSEKKLSGALRVLRELIDGLEGNGPVDLRSGRAELNI